MISSIVWILMYFAGRLNPDHAPWKIFFPVVAVELITYRFALPKICDWLDNRKKAKELEEKSHES